MTSFHDAEINSAARIVTGTEDGFDNYDALVVELVVQHLRKLPGTGRVTRVALQAILALAEHDRPFALSLLAELDA